MNNILTEMSKFTRKDRELLDELRAKAYIPTQEDIEKEKARITQERMDILEEKKARLGIQKPNPVTRERALLFLENINAKEFVGENLSLWIDDQEEIFGSLDIAFDELIIKYL